MEEKKGRRVQTIHIRTQVTKEQDTDLENMSASVSLYKNMSDTMPCDDCHKGKRRTMSKSKNISVYQRMKKKRRRNGDVTKATK